MATIAKLRQAHITPQKARLVADQVRGMRVDRALNILAFSNKKAAGLIKKVLELDSTSGWSALLPVESRGSLANPPAKKTNGKTEEMPLAA